ncbi:G-patch domain-containing protein [Aphelenchoides besseyi]|nr:G-patch domain-containing protein [Aphelenchoides besseyi]
MTTHLFNHRKGVRFVKATDDLESSIKETSDELNGDEISNFYADLMAEPSTSEGAVSDLKTTTEKAETKPTVRKRAKSKNVPVPQLKRFQQFDERDERLFFKAAATNDVNEVVQYLKSGLSPNLVDQFGWTPLMCASAEGSLDTVNILLMYEADITVEAKGMTAELLAAKNKKYKVCELFRKYKKSHNAEEELTPTVSTSGSSFCTVCQVEYNDPNHENSITHVVSLKAKPDVGYSYGIQINNRGYQLIKQMGWKESEGVGKNAEGRKYPIRTSLKRDRKGLGLEKSIKKITHFDALDSKAIEDVKKPLGIRELKRNIDKEQQKIMRLRRILSSD